MKVHKSKIEKVIKRGIFLVIRKDHVPPKTINTPLYICHGRKIYDRRIKVPQVNGCDRCSYRNPEGINGWIITNVAAPINQLPSLDRGCNSSSPKMREIAINWDLHGLLGPRIGIVTGSLFLSPPETLWSFWMRWPLVPYSTVKLLHGLANWSSGLGFHLTINHEERSPKRLTCHGLSMPFEKLDIMEASVLRLCLVSLLIPSLGQVTCSLSLQIS